MGARAAVCLLAILPAADGGGPAPLPRAANPLAGLPALPKPHHSWYRYAKRSDNEATLVDYARITHSVPIVHNANRSEIVAAVNLCYHADGCGTAAGCATTLNCSLALTWSPYVKTMEAAKASHKPADPRTTTPLELAYLAEFQAWATNVTRWAAETSAHNGREVRIGAVILDQEAFNAGADPSPQVRAALTEKNNAYHRAAQLACPGAEIVQYNRGGWQVCPPGEPTCPPQFRNGVHGECTDPKLVRPAIPCTADGFFRDWPYTLDDDELGDSLSVSLYQVPELTNMIAIFNKTAATARAHGLSRVAPFICLGCGAKRDVRYPNGGSWVNTNEWDYDVSYSFLMGALINEKLPWSGPPEPERFGLWSMAHAPVFYPSIVDTQPEGEDDEASLLRAREIRLRHFVAFVRGASLDVSKPELNMPNASECDTDQKMITNHRCIESLMPAPPPPPPPLPATANPLAGLPALPKPHYSWYRALQNSTYSRLGAADNHATLVDYARITHSMPVVHCGSTSTGCPETHAEVNASVAICIEAVDKAGGNCTLSLDWSPYIDESEHLGTRIDPRITTPLEQKALATFATFLRNVTRWAAEASAAQPGGHHITVGAIGLDQEQVCGFCWSHAADGSCNASTFDAITQKNNLYAEAAARLLPGAEVIWYDRGGVHRCMPAALTCSSFDEHGVCTEQKQPWMLEPPVPCDAEGYRRNDCSTLAPDEIGDSLSVSLYSVPEIGRTVQEFNRTAANALAHGKGKVVPYICLGCGYKRDVLYGYGGSVLFSKTWDYDESYSYLLGAYMNAPQFQDQPQRYGLWSMAKSAVFFPSIVDTEGDQCTGASDAQHRNAQSPCVVRSPADARAVRMKHFVAYVQGAATNKKRGMPTSWSHPSPTFAP